MPKRRLDTLLAERGLFETRTRAAAAVMAGDVRVGDRPARKPGRAGRAETPSWRSPSGREFVSRGGIKLANALDALGVDPAGRRALDVGASTGGFTDCLLQRGAAAVIALDVAYGELHWTSAQRRARDRDRAPQRALAASPASCLRAGPDRRRRLVHLAREGAAGGAGGARRRGSTASPSSSRSSRSAASASAGAGWCARRTTGARRSSAVAALRARGARAPRCWGSPRRACRGPPATARASSGSPRPGAPGAVEDLEAAARRAEP